MERSNALALARDAAKGHVARLGPLKSSIIEFGNWIFCFGTTDDQAEWWIAIDDQDGEALVTPQPAPYLPTDWRSPE